MLSWWGARKKEVRIYSLKTSKGVIILVTRALRLHLYFGRLCNWISNIPFPSAMSMNTHGTSYVSGQWCRFAIEVLVFCLSQTRNL